MPKFAVSGRSQFAIKQEKDSWYKLSPEKGFEWVEIPHHVVAGLVASSRDTEWVQASSDEEASLFLATAAAKTTALDFFSFLFDPTLSSETKSTAAHQLAELLTVPGVAAYLNDIFLSSPIPENADFSFAHFIVSKSTTSELEPLKLFLIALIELQPAVKKVRDAWNGISDERFGTQESRKNIESVFLRLGIFARVVLAFGIKNELNTLHFELLNGKRQILDAAVVRGVLQEWIPRLLKDPAANAKKANHQKPLRISSMSSEAETDDEYSRRSPQKSPHDAFAAALSQVRRIVELVKTGKPEQASVVRKQMVQSQLGLDGESTYAIKSLCNIAQELRGEKTEFALDCLNIAVGLPGLADSKSYLQLGTLLTDLRQYEYANKALQNAIDRTSDLDIEGHRRILSALAHVYSEQGDFRTALEMYNSMISADPRCDTFVGKADVLRKSGQVNAATAIYVAVRDSFSSQLNSSSAYHRAEAGLAEIARRRGDPHRAIGIYLSILNRPRFYVEAASRIVYECSLAGLLKAVGQFDAAEKLNNRILKNHQGCARAITLRECIRLLKGDNSRLETDSRDVLRIDGSDSVLIDALRVASKDGLAAGELLLKEQIEVSKRILDFDGLGAFAKAVFRLGMDDQYGARITLESIKSIDRFTREFRQILELHATLIAGDSIRDLFPKFKRSPRIFRQIVAALKNLDFAEATKLEMIALLLAA